MDNSPVIYSLNELDNITKEKRPNMPTMISTYNQTDKETNKGKGLSALQPQKHEPLITEANESVPPLYRDIMRQVFNEEFIGTETREDLTSILKVVRERDWNTLKLINSTFYRI